VSDPSSWPVPAGWSLRYLPVTGSTNDDAKRAARSGCPELTVFLADEQLRGRGRLGREWRAPAGGALLFSILLRRPVTPVLLTALCSVSVVEAITECTGLDPRIKWPNDVMLGERKVCGILSEVVADARRPITVVGIGLNVNLDPQAAGLPPMATSLSNHLGTSVRRGQLFAAIIRRIDDRFRQSMSAHADLIARWQELLWRRWQEVRIDQADQSLRGIVLGLSANGALRVQDERGITEILVGDVLPPG
jgi:BirA family transcriptional regulator, biotin operon repressor / biotin---[acetyl-CoA-carboxylase] ligase